MQQILLSATDRSRLFYLFLFAFFGMFFSASLSGLIFGITADGSVGIWQIRFNGFLQALMMFLLPAYTVFAWSYPQPFRALKLSGAEGTWKNIAWAILILGIAYPFTAFLTQINKELVLPQSMSAVEQWMQNYEGRAMEITDALLSDKSILGLIVNLMLVAGFAALAEELFFRGALQQFLQCMMKNRHLAVWAAAFIFSAIHFQFYGFLPRLALGAILGYLFSYSGNLWIPIAAHFFNNAIVIVMMYYRNFNPEIVDRIDNQPLTVVFAALAAAGLVLSAALFWKYGRQNRERSFHE